MPEYFLIKGQVSEQTSGVGISGLVVRSYDKDAIFDDLMGEDTTACDGSFRIRSEASDFSDLFDIHPDIYLRVSVLLSGGTQVRPSTSGWNSSRHRR